MRRKEAPPGLLWPPQSWLRLFTSLLVQCSHLFSSSFLAYYSDFIMLVWIMWIFTLCFEWNSRTWFRKWREGGGSPLRASSLITSLQAGGFICWTGFDSIHPPHAFAQASKGGLAYTFKTFLDKIFSSGEKSEVCKLERWNKSTQLPPPPPCPKHTPFFVYVQIFRYLIKNRLAKCLRRYFSFKQKMYYHWF